MTALKENNEKDNAEKNKEKESGLVTRESVGAVGALFSLLAFFILCTRSLVFGSIGEAVNSFLLGLFGYIAFPLLLATGYLSVALFLDKRFVKNRKAAAMIIAAFFCAMLILHTALTYSWSLSGYVSRCFNAPAYSKHGIDGCTAAGWVGALIVYFLAKLTTKVGALVILSLIFLVFVYLSVYFLVGKALPRRIGKKKKEAKKTAPAKGTSATSAVPYPPQYPYANMQGMPANGGMPRQPVAPTPPPSEHPYSYVPPYTGAYVPVSDPEVRQRPGVSLPNDNFSQGQPPVPPAVGVNGVSDGTNTAFSPFGTPNVMSASGYPRERSEASPPIAGYPEYQNSKEFLFGGTPAEIYRKNLIFDSNANVNKRPPADPDQPTVYSGSFANSYSTAYADSVNGEEESVRPAKILEDNTRGKDLYNPYTLHESDSEPGFGNSKRYDSDTSAPQEPIQSTFAPFAPPPEPIMPPPPPPVWSEKPQTPGVRLTPPEPSESERSRVDPLPPSPMYGLENTDRSGLRSEEPERGERNGRSLFGDVEPTPAEPAERTRPGFMDIFSASNPNIYGLQDEHRPDLETSRTENPGRNGEFGRGESERAETSRGGRGLFEADEPLIPDRSDESERRSPFEVEASEEPVSSDKRDIFDEAEDSYSIRSEFTDPFRSREEEELPPARASRAEIDGNSRERKEGLFGAERGESPAFEEAPKSAPSPKTPKPRVRKPYQPAPLDYFDCRDVEPDSNAEEVENTKQTIIETLEAFKVNDSTIASVTYGPTVTRYNVVIPRNISARKVVALDQEIAMNLYASKGVNIYPNFEDGAVSIEVPNKTRQFVQLGCMLTGDGFTKSKPTSLVFAMGKDVGNRKIYGDICKMTHLLVAGASGSGKSVFLRSLIISLIIKYSPQELRLILIDPKKTEFVIYDHLPHLMINEIITDINKTIQSLNWAIGEMNRRYGLFEQMSRAGTYVVNIDEYNSNLPAGEEKLPKIVIIVDELADLMLSAKKEVEDRIQNLTQKSRAAGIHLIIATQRPSADVITGVIKGNLPTRIAFAVASDVDSRVILDTSGAQKLLGLGDLLYLMAGMNTPTRVQGSSISSEDAQKVVNYIKANNEAEYDESASAFINNTKQPGEESEEGDDDSVEEVYIDALRSIILNGSASISMIQRKCSVGYNKAGKIIEWMEDMGYISAFDGAKARKVLITKEDFEVKYGPL